MTNRTGTQPDAAATGWPDDAVDADRHRDGADRHPATAEPYPDLDRRPAGDDAATTVTPLLDDATAEPFAVRWSDVQARFVDDPRGAVQEADGLVEELVHELNERFARRKGELEEHWNRGDEPDTEALRQALQQYRAFFDRLLIT